MNNQSLIQFEILLQRMYFYHLAATYMPTICLLIIAEITLFIDESHFDTTVMVSLTSMLVMYTLYQSIAGTLPQTAYLKMIDIWLLFGLMMPFIVFLLEVTFLFLKLKFEEEENEDNTVKPLTFMLPDSNNFEHSGKKIVMFKKGSKVCVPVVTVGFIVLYWLIALLHYNLMLG
jgi:hypothetical protein